MHTFRGESCLIHHNSDMSGDCIIVNQESREEVSVSCQDIVNFVNEYFKERIIEVFNDEMKVKDVLCRAMERGWKPN